MGLSLRGTTSGAVDINAPAVAGDNTITLPGTNGAANQFYKNSGTAGIVTHSSMIEDSSGRIGIGTDSPSESLSLGGNMDFKQSSNLTTTVGYLNIAPNGSLILDTDTGHIDFRIASSERMRLSSAGNLGIGTDSPGTPLTVKSLDNADSISIHGRNADGISNFTLYGSDGATQYGRIQARSTYLHLAAGDSTKGTYIDSSGRLLVGTSSAATVGQAQYGFIRNIGNTSGLSGYGVNSIGRGIAASTVIGSNATLGMLTFTDSIGGEFGRIECRTANSTSSSSYPGDLRFYTTADGSTSPTERVRITNNGAFKATTTGSHVSTTSQTHAFNSNITSATLEIRNQITDYTANHFILHNDCNNSSSSVYNFMVCNMGGVGNVFRIAKNGNVTNTNNSYGPISDQKLKENIVDANSQWEDIKSLRIVNFNFKAETGYETHKQIGLIAQEVETVCPGLISETNDTEEVSVPMLDENGVAQTNLDGQVEYVLETRETGETTKVVSTSVLYMKAIKALQEAMTKIETLETQNADLLSRVTALEG